MGTRGAWGFRMGGEDKVTFVSMDSYPEGWPEDLVEVFKHTNLEVLPARVAAWKGVSMDDFAGMDKTPAKSNFEEMLNLGLFSDNRDFLKDSLFCEWAYIFNLDAGVFEVYTGFNRQVDAVEGLLIRSSGDYGRYWDKETSDEGDYMGVRLVKTFPLYEIPDDWIRVVQEVTAETK